MPPTDEKQSMKNKRSETQCHLLNTGFCTVRESHLICGGRGVVVHCPAFVGLLHHPAYGWILFDTGYAPRVYHASSRLPYRIYRGIAPFISEQEGTVAAQLAPFGITPDDIGTVIVSHLHADHIGGLRDFPKARFVVQEIAWRDVQHRTGWNALRKGFLPDLLPSDFEERAIWVSPAKEPWKHPDSTSGTLFADAAFTLVDLPGHAVGQMGLLAETDRGTVFFTADACYLSRSIRENIPPHPSTNLFTEGGRIVQETLTRLHRLSQERPDIQFIPTHCTEVFVNRFDAVARSFPQANPVHYQHYQGYSQEKHKT
jgi:glyoxylase-like metal-dependent hydrolase (beta-lactamase superfamily II)